MKKIIFIIPSLGIGGLERVQITIANMLVKHGYDVTIMVLEPVYEMKDELDENVHFVYKPPKKHFGNRIPYIRHKFYDDGMWETRASANQLYKYYIGDEYYDVEIAFFRGMPVKIVSGSINNSAKHIAWVHSNPTMAVGFSNNFKSTHEVFEAYKTLDTVVCVSKQVINGFIESIGDTGNITCIYNMLPVSEIQNKGKEKKAIRIDRAKFHIVLVGRFIDTTKGQSRLINVVCRLKDEGADISLGLVGSGIDEAFFHNLVRKKHAEDYIHIIDGGLNPYPYINEADLLVCASFFEGYNLTVAEALILGVPVLSTDCSGPNEILDYGKYGMIVDNSEEGLYNGLKKLLDNPELLQEYRAKTLERQSFFDEREILNRIINLFER